MKNFNIAKLLLTSIVFFINCLSAYNKYKKLSILQKMIINIFFMIESFYLAITRHGENYFIKIH